jgi:hypothetical protein
MLQTKNPVPTKQNPDAQPPPQTKSDKDKEKRKDRRNKGESSTRTTRSTEIDRRRMSREEIEVMTWQEVTNAKEGKWYLESMLLTVPGTPYSVSKLSGALFQISMLAGIKTSWANVNTIHAIAYILTEIDMDKKTQSFADTMTGRLERQKQLLENEVKTITEQAAVKVTKITDWLNSRESAWVCREVL